MVTNILNDQSALILRVKQPLV